MEVPNGLRYHDVGGEFTVTVNFKCERKINTTYIERCTCATTNTCKSHTFTVNRRGAHFFFLNRKGHSILPKIKSQRTLWCLATKIYPHTIIYYHSKRSHGLLTVRENSTSKGVIRPFAKNRSRSFAKEIL